MRALSHTLPQFAPAADKFAHIDVVDRSILDIYFVGHETCSVIFGTVGYPSGDGHASGVAQ